MCGIAGELSRSGRPIDLAAFAARLHLLAPRGPDSRGVFAADAAASSPAEWTWRGGTGPRPIETAACPDPLRGLARVALGAHRLAIVGRDPRGDQPLSDDSGRYRIVFNGEIYNYREIRADLAALGVRFGSDTDTEVVAAAWARWGPRAFSRFNGMWAAAIWDRVERMIVLSRDDLGIKPLHVYVDDEVVLFGSELRLFLADPRVRTRGRLNGRVVASYLAHRLVNHTEETWWRPVRAVPPGALWTCRIDGGEPHVRPIIDCIGRDVDAGRDGGDPEGLRSRFAAEVSIRVPSDLPSVILLSGGIDSSAISVCAARDPGLGLARLLTAVHEDPSNDERPFAREVAQACAAPLEEVPVAAAATWEDLIRLMGLIEEPPRWNVVPQWRMMEAIRQRGVKVFLEGQGGDEIFGGYPPLVYRAAACSAAAGGRWIQARRISRGVPLRGTSGWEGLLPRRLRRMLGAAMKTPYWMDPALHREHRDVLEAEDDHLISARADFRGAGHAGAMLRRGTLPFLLRVGDRLAGACSLEGRMPFLAQPFVRYMRRWPASELVRDGVAKAAFRAALSRDLPPRVRDRRSKFGFMPPSAPTTLTLLDLIEAERRGGRLLSRDFVRWEWIDRFGAEIRSRPYEWFYPLWQCVNTEIWLRHLS